jgi:hypothetical protein
MKISGFSAQFAGRKPLSVSVFVCFSCPTIAAGMTDDGLQMRYAVCRGR